LGGGFKPEKGALMKKIPTPMREKILSLVKVAKCNGLSTFQAIQEIKFSWLRGNYSDFDEITDYFPTFRTIYRWINDSQKKMKKSMALDGLQQCSIPKIGIDSSVLDLEIVLENYSVVDQRKQMLIGKPILECKICKETRKILALKIIDSKNGNSTGGVGQEILPRKSDECGKGLQN